MGTPLRRMTDRVIKVSLASTILTFVFNLFIIIYFEGINTSWRGGSYENNVNSLVVVSVVLLIIKATIFIPRVIFLAKWHNNENDKIYTALRKTYIINIVLLTYHLLTLTGTVFNGVDVSGSDDIYNSIVLIPLISTTILAAFSIAIIVLIRLELDKVKKRHRKNKAERRAAKLARRQKRIDQRKARRN